MQKIAGIALIALSAFGLILALLTAVNLGFIMTRPDSISVAKAFVGQFVVIVGTLVLGRWFYRLGRSRLAGAALDGKSRD